MQVFIALIWVFLVLVALILPVAMLIWLWHRFQGIFDQLSITASKLERTLAKSSQPAPASPMILRKSGVEADDATVEAARQIRKNVAASRQQQRLNRLDKAKSRWQKLGLIQ